MTTFETQFCSDIARQQGVPLMATATRADIWFLLEYPFRWGAKAFEESDLPPLVKDHLRSAEQPGLKLRIQMIRQDDSVHREGIHFFIGQTCLETPRIYHYLLSDYDDLLDMDLKAMAAGKAGSSADLRSEPLFLVCTNGKRDQCCARYGPDLYRAMQAEAGEAVWQSSHIGGHNKAPVNLFFPHGVHYGQITPEAVGEVMKSYRQGKVVMKYYRGRVCLDPPLQAAEHLWRERTSVLSLTGVRFGELQQKGENIWRVKIQGPDGSLTTVEVVRETTDYEIPTTCAGDKTSPIVSYRLRR
jgi:hypothetical protein